MKASLLHLHDIDKVFHTEEVETHALAKVSLSIENGEYVSITGPSGCGKSTLLSLLGLLDTPTGGRYTLSGQEVSGIPAKERARIRNREIGFVFQSFNLIGDLDARGNVELPLTYRRDLGKIERREMARAAIEKVDMTARAGHYPSQLSGGQQQRVAIARAIAGGPSILLADEPTGNLDTHNAVVVLDLLDVLHAEGSTICMVTHDPRSTERSERTVRMLDGAIVPDEATPAVAAIEERLRASA